MPQELGRKSLFAFVPCWLLPYRWESPFDGRKRWRIGHRWDVTAHGPAGTSFECLRCEATR